MNLEQGAKLDHLDQQDREDPLVLLVNQEHQVSEVNQDCLGQPDRWVQQAQGVKLDFQEHLAKEENLVYKDLKGLVANEVLLVLLDHKVLVEHVEYQGCLDHKDREVNKDQEANLEPKDHQDHLGQWDLLDHVEKLDCQEVQEQLDLLAHLVKGVNLELEASQG